MRAYAYIFMIVVIEATGTSSEVAGNAPVSLIYAVGGADYDAKNFYTLTDRTGAVQRLGSRRNG